MQNNIPMLKMVIFGQKSKNDNFVISPKKLIFDENKTLFIVKGDMIKTQADPFLVKISF